MNKKQYTKKRRKGNFIGFILFFFSTAIILTGYLPEALSWEDTSFVTSEYAMFFTGICMAVLIIASFFISIFPRRISIDKKVLIDLGLIAVAFGITGITGLVFQNKVSFIDAIYITFQLFVGESGSISYSMGSFPLLLNISRFLALFVTFGAIAVLVLREKISQLNIRIFYRDVVILTDCIDKRISALADKLSESNRKIVIGLLKPTQEIAFQSNERIPVIEFDIDKTLTRGLYYCNIRRSKCIYLFCENTSDNIILFRAVKGIFNNPDKKSRKSKNVLEDDIAVASSDEMLQNLYTALKDKAPQILNKKSRKRRAVKCFIQYKTYSEKEYYAIDNSLSEKSHKLETYFINPDINALRQMISGIALRNMINMFPNQSAEDLVEKLRGIKIGVAGSGALLESAAYEIPRLCTFSDSEKLEIYFLGGMTEAIRFKASVANSKLNQSVVIHDVNINSGNTNTPEIDLLFICSESEMQIKSVVHSVFQRGLYKNIRELLILTEGNRIEFEILNKYISNLSGQYPFIGAGVFSTIHLGNTVDLIMSIDDFYSSYGPDIHSVHEAYLKSMSTGMISDFSKLPEELIESNLLTSIHNHLILGMLSSLFSDTTKEMMSEAGFKKIIAYLASVEHERWYRERLLQGYVLAETHDYLLNKNPYMKHWSSLNEETKDKNISYLLNTLYVQYNKQTAVVFDAYLPEIIRQQRYSTNKGSELDEV